MPYGRVFAVAVLATTASLVQAAPPALMEIELADRTLQGKLVALDDKTAWLLARDGALEPLAVREIKQASAAAPQFEPFRSAELRDALRREFREGFDVVGTEHYLIVAPPDRARHYAEVFENIYRTFYVYFRVRGFQLNEPEFPLVAIVFPDQAAFDQYCRRDGFRAFRGLMGYYLRTSNRVALFDPGDETVSADNRAPLGHRPAATIGEVIGAGLPTPPMIRPQVSPIHAFLNLSDEASVAAPNARVATIAAGLRDTMIHEATHQVAFNTGLHTRIGENPKWVVEGLATVFEAPGVRDPGGSRTVASRLNRERFDWFASFAQERRSAKSLAAFVASDQPFEAAALDGYSQAWALSFFLLETRSGKYARYLRGIADRDPLKPYPQSDRLADFQAQFGQDLTLLEADFLRFMDRLRSEEERSSQPAAGQR